MDSSKIKGLLLKSGIPLEVSVVKKLAKFDVVDFGEVEYERDGNIFTTDLDLKKDFDLLKNLGLRVNFVIECKYKTRDHQWFFMKFPEEFIFPIRSDVSNEVFDGFFAPLLNKMGYQLNDKYAGLWDFRPVNLFKLKTANKGVDILKNNFDPTIIKEAVSQVVFGSIKVHRDSIQFNLEMLSNVLNFTTEDDSEYIHSITSITIPIIVTTAKLFRVKDNISVEDIEKEKDILNLCDEEKGILLFNKDYSNVRKYTKYLDKKEPIYFKDKILDWLRGFWGAEEFMDIRKNMLKSCHPGYVYIINYEHLEELFSTCLECIEELCKEFPKKYLKKKA